MKRRLRALAVDLVSLAAEQLDLETSDAGELDRLAGDLRRARAALAGAERSRARLQLCVEEYRRGAAVVAARGDVGRAR
jgi:hypothetical protein